MKGILALDQSTSATKAVLFDATGAVLDRAVREHRQHYPQPGWVEHDAEEIWCNTLEVIGEIVARQPERVAELAGLSLTNQRETAVLFERGTGRPLHPAIVWQCRRGDPLCERLRAAGHEPRVRARTGLRIDTYFSASKFAWLLQERPELAVRVRRGDAVLGTIDAYLIHRLTAGRVFATDPTNASRTLLYDIGARRWDPELAGLFGISLEALPEVRESFATFGETRAGDRLPRSLPICGVIGDSQASLFAQRCYTPGMVKATFGSGTSVLLNVGDRRPAPPEGTVSALAWVLHDRPTYALEGLIHYSAATIAWLEKQLGLIRSAAETEAMARAVEDNGGVYLVPAFAGLGAPHWSAEARAALLGMTAHTRKEHVVRAALEAIAYQIRDVLELMRAGAGVNPTALHADGGPTQNEFLMQFTADLTRLPVKAARVSDASALGAALAGLTGLGIHGSLADLAALPRPVRTYQPTLDEARAGALYAGWQAAVQRVL